jgi:hypothetical protein
MFVTDPKKNDIKTIRQGEPNFMLYDGLVAYPRAMLHVTPECPRVYRDALQMAMDGGYIKLVAHVQGKELTWEKLTA